MSAHSQVLRRARLNFLWPSLKVVRFSVGPTVDIKSHVEWPLSRPSSMNVKIRLSEFTRLFQLKEWATGSQNGTISVESPGSLYPLSLHVSY